MTPYTYKGWLISYNPNNPVTGTWRAERFGVGMCHNSEAAVKRMVDYKVYKAQEERRKRDSQT